MFCRIKQLIFSRLSYASEIEDDEAFVKEISFLAEKYLPDYDEEKIYEEWKTVEKNY